MLGGVREEFQPFSWAGNTPGRLGEFLLDNMKTGEINRNINFFKGKLCDPSRLPVPAATTRK